ncbi:hypothetical protein ACFVR1_13955 [Psychrobacillus sp. NPDC058041]|uniref:hypothetical protein n=1 Tax=Psychrobacillus sp. NPDC058041 TaxID=3346310 RepID=UPI0036DD5DD5
MKKAYIILVLLLLAGCGAKTKSLQEIYTGEGMKEVDKIVLTDGSTGSSKTITNGTTINELMSLIKDIQFTPQANQEKQLGWRYSIGLYEGDKEFKFYLNKIGKYYYHSNPDIFPIVDDFYKDLNVE